MVSRERYFPRVRKKKQMGCVTSYIPTEEVVTAAESAVSVDDSLFRHYRTFLGSLYSGRDSVLQQSRFINALFGWLEQQQSMSNRLRAQLWSLAFPIRLGTLRGSPVILCPLSWKQQPPTDAWTGLSRPEGRDLVQEEVCYQPSGLSFTKDMFNDDCRVVLDDVTWNDPRIDPGYFACIERLTMCHAADGTPYLAGITSTVRRLASPHQPSIRMMAATAADIMARLPALARSVDPVATVAVMDQIQSRYSIAGTHGWSGTTTHLYIPASEPDLTTTALEDSALQHLRQLRDQHNCRVLLMEFFSSETGLAFRTAFLRRLFALAHEPGQPMMMIVADDSMMSVRCGALFSYQLYPPEIRPDFVVVERGWMLGALVHISPDQPSDGLWGASAPPPAILLRRCLRFLRIVESAKLPEKCRAIGGVLGNHTDVLSSVGAFAYIVDRAPDFSDVPDVLNERGRNRRLLPVFTLPIDDLLMYLKHLSTESDDDDTFTDLYDTSDLSDALSEDVLVPEGHTDDP